MLHARREVSKGLQTTQSPARLLSTWATAFLLFLMVLSPLVQAAPEATTPTSTTATPAAESPAELQLKRVFAGGTPSSVAELRGMQSHVQKLTEQLMKCTVGVQVGAAQGSGVIISKDGYVLTAAHVAGQPNKDVLFLFPDGRTLRGKTLGLDRSMDAGLMKITEGTDFPFIEMGASEGLKVGQWCLATGHPGGYQPDRKPVLRLGRIVFLDNIAVTTDCTLVGGDSGGPLFDMDGKVIGINSRISGPITANMHVPVDTFRTNWDRLVKAEAWGHYPGQEPYIGIRGEPNTQGAKIAYVYPNSPAEKAGIKIGDVVTSIGKTKLKDFAALSASIREHQPGDTIKLYVRRGEEQLELKLRIGKRGNS